MPTKTGIQQRKHQLIAEGAVYRAGLVVARRELKDCVRGTSLARQAAGMMRGVAGQVFNGKGILPMLLPLLTSGFSAVAKRPRLQHLVRNTVVVAIAAISINVLLRKKASAVKSDAMPD